MLPERASKKPLLTAVSGARISRFALIRRCMHGYLSPILVDSILTKAMDARGFATRPNSDELLPELIEECIAGLRLFVEPARFPELVGRLRVLAAKDA
jgi:hypothetical protein